MQLATVIENMKRTIKQKQEFLSQMSANPTSSDVDKVVCDFLAINIAELERILADLLKVAKQESDASWKENPDRMGGAFTQEEIDNATNWR